MKASLSAVSGQSGLGAVLEQARHRGPLARFELRGRHSILAWSGAALSQGQLLPRVEFRSRRSISQGQVQISWQAHHFRKVTSRFHSRRSTFAMSSTDFVAGAALWQDQVQISWQAQHFGKVKYRIRGRRSTFAMSNADFVTGAAFSPGKVECRFRGRAALWQGQVQILWQGQHFRKVECRCRRKCSTLASRFRGNRRTAGAALSQGRVQISWQAQHYRKFRYSWIDRYIR